MDFKNFKDYIFQNLSEAVVNKHSTHIEENFLVNGKQGLLDTVEGLQYIIDTIGSGKPDISTKIDGAPAVIFGWSKDGFFVATKAIFNKVPKINYSNDDIDNNHDGDLADKLKIALECLRDITPKDGSVYQGDVLFSKSSLKSLNVDGKACYAWHPNTIVYTVEKDSDLGKAVGNAEFGIAVHTRYTWQDSDPTTLSVGGFGVSKDVFKDSKDVFMVDTVSNLTNSKVCFDPNEVKELEKILSSIKAYGSKIKWNEINDERVMHLMTFFNTYIRAGSPMPSPKKREDEWIAYITAKANNEVEKKKTENGKETARQKFADVLEFKGLSDIFAVFDLITKAKLMILNQLNKMKMYNNFVLTTNGDYIPTKDEGFVCVQTGSKGCKLVDRYEFSRNNFSKDIVAGFEK